MAPCRQLLMWSVPSIAVLLGIFWFKKKREYAKSDPGGREKIKSLKEELADALKAEVEIKKTSPVGKAERSVIKSAPIDIIPRGTGSQRSSPLELTDEEVDLEIEKIIRKKSVDKERKMSYNVENSFVTHYNKESSFVNKNMQCNLFSPPKNDVKVCDQNIAVCLLKADEAVVNTMANETIPDDNIKDTKSTELDVVVSESNATEENTVADTEELNVNNDLVNEPSESSQSSDSGDRYSAPQSRRISERDSANHSPVDPMLASPSMCHFSDNHSEVCMNKQYT